MHNKVTEAIREGVYDGQVRRPASDGLAMLSRKKQRQVANLIVL